MTTEDVRLPLAGVRVADFTWMIAGPMATRTLANLGAEVIRIESSGRVDLIRVGQPRFDGASDYSGNPNGSPVFNNVNTSKLSVTLNLAMPGAREVARRIVQVSDIVMNNYSGGVMDRWGLGYDDLVEVNPRVIYLEMPTMGATGSQRGYRGNGPHLSAITGLIAANGWAGDRPPIGPDIAYSDFSSNPNVAAISVLAALHHRNRTGRGQRIDLSQFQATASLMAVGLLEASANGRSPGHVGNHHPAFSPHDVFPCADEPELGAQGSDRWVAIAIRTDEEWSRLVSAMGSPDWAQAPAYGRIEGRREAENAIRAAIGQWTSTQKAHALAEDLQSLGIAAGVVQDIRDLIEEDDNWRERQFAYTSNPESGEFAVHREPIKFQGAPARLERAPLLGEHTAYVLQELLGMTDDEMNALYIEGALT